MIGETIAHYEITGKLGEGAMGEVYRATDPRLKRDVAIKLLSSRLAADAELVARMRREAEVLASLNHAHIGQIYGLEPSGDSFALVLELVEGETLADRLQKGPLPPDRALKVAHQIAAALETAHEGGIIHRDLKPANVKRTPEGDVKVLDFGLAKGVGVDQSQTDLTAAGQVIGTPAYMSPEQVAGKPLDRRTDIWSFGCLLYEMLTGTKAFAGDSVGSLFAAIATEPPDLERIVAPPPVQELVARCLRKDPRQRLRDIGDARVEIEEILTGQSPAAASAAPARSRPLAAIAALLLGGVIGAVAAWSPEPETASAERKPARYSIALPPSPGTLHLDSPTGAAPPLDVSRDGRKVVFAAIGPGGVRQLYLRTADDPRARPIPNTERGEAPFFSPDGKHIGYTPLDGEGLGRISLADHSVAMIARTFVVRGASWGEDGTIVFAHTDHGLEEVAAEGGEPRPLTRVAEDEQHHRWPQILPDGKQVLFTVLMRDGRLQPRIVVRATGETFPVGVQGSFARYLEAGYIVYTKAEHVWAVRFDLATRKTVGDPVQMLSGIHVSKLGDPHVALSAQGVLVYEPIRPPSPGRSLVWVDRQGNTESIDQGKGFEFPRLSPDGKELVFANHTETNSHDIWRINLERKPYNPLPVTSGGNFVKPTWSDDGKAIVFTEFGARNLWTKSLEGASPAKILLNKFGWQFPLQWKDGRILFDETVPGRGPDLAEVRIADMSVRTLITSIDAERGASISPDGRWLAYVSNRTGKAEVYLQSYPGLGREERVSRNGGSEPLWSRDGKELFFRRGRGLFSVAMDNGRIGETTLVLEGTFVEGFLESANYDVTNDGKRFVMVDGGWGLTQGRLDLHLHFDREIAGKLGK